MIPRLLTARLERARRGFPAILICGPRQTGKTWLARSVFAELPYANLEDPIQRVAFAEDPVSFLEGFPGGGVLDEVHHAPDLLSFLQVRIDDDRQMGRWILTGSHQPELMRQASQSLAGRVATFELLPFSHFELADSPRRPRTVDEAILLGGMAPLFDEARQLDPGEWLNAYLTNHVHRDVRTIVTPRDPLQFDSFLRQCAVRTGQEWVASGVATDVGISRPNVEAWLNALRANFLVRLVPPYHRNLRKRLVKKPKLHFLDTGVACRLLQISDVQQLSQSPARGALFESWCYAEILKTTTALGWNVNLWHWRSDGGLEVDLLLEMDGQLVPIEIKANRSPTSTHANNAVHFSDHLSGFDGVRAGRPLVIYGGDENVRRGKADFAAWHSIRESLESSG